MSISTALNSFDYAMISSDSEGFLSFLQGKSHSYPGCEALSQTRCCVETEERLGRFCIHMYNVHVIYHFIFVATKKSESFFSSLDSVLSEVR